MKHIKLIIIFILVSLGLVYTYRSTCAIMVDKGPGLALHNQSELNILFRIFVNNKKIFDTGNRPLVPNGEYHWDVNLNDVITIEVYEALSKSILDKIKIDAKGKTKYLAWNPKRYNKPALYFFPQEKSLGGYSLFNNVEQKDIIRMKSKI